MKWGIMKFKKRTDFVFFFLAFKSILFLRMLSLLVENSSNGPKKSTKFLLNTNQF